MRSRVGILAALLAGSASCFAVGCAVIRPMRPTPSSIADAVDALAVSDALEALIAEGRDTAADREAAYRALERFTEKDAPSYFARAAVTGRLVQQRGLRVAHLVEDVERSARKSVKLDPKFRDGAATRLLGTLYVIAPGMLLKHGNSEVGLEMLEGLVKEYPKVLENQLRLAEAYITLGDPGPACPYLCRCSSDRASLGRDDQRLLDQLLEDAGTLQCCPEARRT